MTEVQRTSRVGFVVIKASVAGTPYFLMRVNSKWKDINFIGGHEKQRDAGDLKKTARRELWEEVPSIRRYAMFELESLTPELGHGPIFSKSKGDKVAYCLQFFLLRISSSAKPLVELLSSRSRNVWVPQHELLSGKKYRVSTLVNVLNSSLPDGLDGIGFSFVADLRMFMQQIEKRDSKQLEFALK